MIELSQTDVNVAALHGLGLSFLLTKLNLVGAAALTCLFCAASPKVLEAFRSFVTHGYLYESNERRKR